MPASNPYRIVLFLLFVLYAADTPAQSPDTNFLYTNLDSALLHPELVHRLSLRKKRLKAIPPQVFKLTHLRELSLAKNKLKALPDEIGQLKHLRKLDLTGNRIDSLSPQLGQLTKLVNLKLGDNEIYHLPEEVANMSRLERIELWDNNLAVLPPDMATLQKLKFIDMRGIQLNSGEQKAIEELLPKADVRLSEPCGSCR